MPPIESENQSNFKNSNRSRDESDDPKKQVELDAIPPGEYYSTNIDLPINLNKNLALPSNVESLIGIQSSATSPLTKPV